MLTEHEWVGERIKLHRLMQDHPDWGGRRLGRALGHDPKWVAKWRQRLRSHSPLTLDSFRSASRAPKQVHQRISESAKTVIVDLRLRLSERFYRKAGAKTIQYGIREYLKQHPEALGLPRSSSTIYRILHEKGCILPRSASSHTPLVLPSPMDEWELDFGEVYLPDDTVIFEFLVVVDRGTSRLVYLEGSTGYNAETALEALARLFAACGLPKRLRFDRDPRLWGAWTRDSYPSPMIRLLRVLGIEDVPCPPRRPDLKPFVERCIETLKYESFARVAPTTLPEAYAVLEAFPHYYNEERPHQGQACQNRPPDEAFPVASLPLLPSLPDEVDPDRWLQTLQHRTYERRVTSDGTIQIDRHTYAIGRNHKHQPVTAHVVGEQFHMVCAGGIVKRLPIRGLYRQIMDFDSYLVVLRSEARTLEFHYQSLWRRRSESA